MSFFLSFIKLENPIRFIDGASRAFLTFNYADGGHGRLYD